MNRINVCLVRVIRAAAVSLVLASGACTRGPEERQQSSQRGKGLVDNVQSTKQLDVAYGDYEPYTIEDPNTKIVTGFSAEILERVAKDLGCKVVWHRVNWDTMSADLKRGQFDIIADPIFQTVSRAPEFAFSEPYTYFADGIVVVKAGDNRFKNLDDLDKPGIKVSVGLGQASETIVKARFKHAMIESTPVGSDNMQIFGAVLTGRSDAAVADAVNATKFIEAHPKQFKAINLQTPPVFIPAGFALEKGDLEGANFMNVAINYLRTTGELDQLARKYRIPSSLKAGAQTTP